MAQHVIYRYPLELEPIQAIMTIPGEVLRISESKKGLSMWVQSPEFGVDEAVGELVQRFLYLVNTGSPHTLPPGAKYISTIFQGDYVFHFFLGE